MKQLAGVFLLYFPVQAIVGLIEAFSLMQIWNWLVAEEYGLPQLNGWEALGLSLVAQAFLHRYDPTPKEEETPFEAAIRIVTSTVVYHGFAVLIAFIIYVNLP